MLEKIIKIFRDAKPSEIKVKWGGPEKFYNNKYSIQEGNFNFEISKHLGGDYPYRLAVSYEITAYKDGKVIKSFDSSFNLKNSKKGLLVDAYEQIEKKVGTYLKQKEENREKVNDKERAKGLNELKRILHTK